jgi:hypothetical protein
MASEANQILPTADEPIVNKNKSASGVESDASTSSSSNAAVKKMANKITPSMSDYWKKLTITKDDRSAYHAADWLSGELESIVPTMECPTVDGTTIVCFESHLIARLDLPPSKFLLAIMNFLGCELVHFNPNATTALSCFAMLCECWLEIAPDTSLFWSIYNPPDMTRLLTLGLGCRCVTAVGKLISMPPSRAPGGVPLKGDSWLICMLLLNGRTDICSRCLSITSGES